MKLKDRKRRDKEEGRWEKGGTEGYLKDISQNVGEGEERERQGGRRNSVMELRKEEAKKNMGPAQT